MDTVKEQTHTFLMFRNKTRKNRTEFKLCFTFVLQKMCLADILFTFGVVFGSAAAFEYFLFKELFLSKPHEEYALVYSCQKWRPFGKKTTSNGMKHAC